MGPPLSSPKDGVSWFGYYQTRGELGSRGGGGLGCGSGLVRAEGVAWGVGDPLLGCVKAVKSLLVPSGSGT